MHSEKEKRLFQEIIEQHKGILLKVARGYCRNDVDRQDLIQEMMIQIWQSLHRYHYEYKMSTWLYRISLNVAISFYRKSSSRAGRYTQTDDPSVHVASQSEYTEDDRNLELLERFISELKEIDKALMILYLEDKTHAEIAEILGMTITNVGTKVGRIKNKLGQRFSQHNHEEDGRN